MARKKRAPKLTFAFTAVPKHITRSDAWFACRPAARLIWIAVLERFNGSNNGSISLSVREAAEYAGCSPNTAGRMFDELIDAGLLICSQTSSFTSGKRLARLWELTHLPKEGKVATNLWKHVSAKASGKRDTI